MASNVLPAVWPHSDMNLSDTTQNSLNVTDLAEVTRPSSALGVRIILLSGNLNIIVDQARSLLLVMMLLSLVGNGLALYCLLIKRFCPDKA